MKHVLVCMDNYFMISPFHKYLEIIVNEDIEKNLELYDNIDISLFLSRTKLSFI